MQVLALKTYIDFILDLNLNGNMIVNVEDGIMNVAAAVEFNSRYSYTVNMKTIIVVCCNERDNCSSGSIKYDIFREPQLAEDISPISYEPQLKWPRLCSKFKQFTSST